MGRGFTLIETIISLALVAILILAVSSMNLLSVRINRSTKGRDGAFNMARGLCEMYRVQELSDSSYNGDKVFKYINSIEDVDSLSDVFDDKDGVYTGQELVSAARSEGYIVVLEPVRVYAPMPSSLPVPEVVTLKVTVFENKPQGARVSLALIR